MIQGVGTDLCSIGRIEQAMKNPRFAERIFTENERKRLENLCDKRRFERAAGMFAAKEAVAKAFGTGFSGFGFSDIEILADDNGCPFVHLYGGAAERAGGANIHLSISHDGGLALAFAVLETSGEG